jgi:hypothetical protein
MGRGVASVRRDNMTGDGGDMDTWLWQSASDLGRGIGRGEIDPWR